MKGLGVGGWGLGTETARLRSLRIAFSLIALALVSACSTMHRTRAGYPQSERRETHVAATLFLVGAIVGGLVWAYVQVTSELADNFH